MKRALKNYRHLLRALDRIGAAVQKQYGASMACRKGCSECCILTSVFPIEAHAIHQYVQSHPGCIKDTLTKKGKGRACHFLNPEGVCLIYPARPVICRTHGNPLLIEGRLDFCRKNFNGVKRIKSDVLVPLEGLNRALVSLNREFLKSHEGRPLPLRVSLARIQSVFKKRP